MPVAILTEGGAALACSHESWTVGAGGGDCGDCGVACSVDEHASSTSNAAQPARTVVRIVTPLSSSRGMDSVPFVCGGVSSTQQAGKIQPLQN
jgi:hypothetical protein